MKKLIIIAIFFLFKVANGQENKNFVGTWTLLYSLQPNMHHCNLPKENDTLILSADSTYSWNKGSIIKGKWIIKENKIKLYSNKATNFKGTVSDIMYPTEIHADTLIIHQPTGGDISCPIRYYKKVKY